MRGWTRKQIIDRLRTADAASLYGEAAAVRDAVHGRAVHLRALLETGNACRCSCLYCGLRRENRSLRRYALDAEVVVRTVCRAVGGGFRTVVIQSGEDPGCAPDSIVDLIASIRDCADAAITLSFGEWPAGAYRAWRRAGADRYLLKFETANPVQYARLRPGRTLCARLACLRSLKTAGFQVGTGFMVGLPGQTLEDLADNLLLVRELDPDMAGIGPYIPHPGTPLGRSCMKGKGPAWAEDPAFKGCDPGEMTLRCVAMARIMNPAQHLPATTALGVRLAGGYLKGLSAGANVLMIGVTPRYGSVLYDIYPGRRQGNDEDPSGLWKRHAEWLTAEGYSVSGDRGDGIRQHQASYACAHA
jgi:biotin synthase